jgi:hypothetical protein
MRICVLFAKTPVIARPSVIKACPIVTNSARYFVGAVSEKVVMIIPVQAPTPRPAKRRNMARHRKTVIINGMGLSILPEVTLSKLKSDVNIFPIANGPIRSIGIATHHVSSPAVVALRKLIIDYSRSIHSGTGGVTNKDQTL